MIKLIIIDNYDSFTYNLVHYLEPYCKEITIFRNDEINHDLISEEHKILISPGPGLPSDNKELKYSIKKYHLSNNIFGVCLGFQAIGQFFGAELHNLKKVRHGIQTQLEILNNEFLFKNVPKQLKVTALDFENYPMAFRHSDLKISGIQFHPESILTDYGKQILQNWIIS